MNHVIGWVCARVRSGRYPDGARRLALPRVPPERPSRRKSRSRSVSPISLRRMVRW